MWLALFHVDVGKKQLRITVGHSIKGLSAVVHNPRLALLGRNRKMRVASKIKPFRSQTDNF